MVMVVTVIPQEADVLFSGNLKQTFDIEDPEQGELDLSRMAQEGGLDSILRFITLCRHRLCGVIGESVILVNFREPDENTAAASELPFCPN
jgi:hypothetical protein